MRLHKFGLHLSILILATATKATSSENPGQNLTEKCPYKDTVDLSNIKPLDNGSFMYHNTVIEEHKLAQYDYRLAAYNERKNSELHWRGCVCDSTKPCVKVCCEWGEYFDETSYRCEKIPDHLNVPTELTIISMDTPDRLVNIYEHFTYQVGLPCKHPESLTMEDDQWHLMEVGN